MVSPDDAMDDDILALFIEDTKEHLAGIESSLMDMESDPENLDPELVNQVFRAAHSIKGGAGFLNLNNIRDLAHKLENVLHMIRNKEIVPYKRVTSKLLSGFDTLLHLVLDADHSDEKDISADIRELTDLTETLLPEQDKGAQEKTVDLRLPDGRVVFTMDKLTLANATKGGHFLYLVEYDLIHDVHGQKKTPLDVIKAMESSGLIVDCKVDMGAVGDLEGALTNVIPFYVLFSTIVEPDIISYLFAINQDRIHPLTPGEETAAPEPAAPTEPAEPAAPEPVPDTAYTLEQGPFTATGDAAQAAISLAAGLTADTVADLRELLIAAQARSHTVRLDVSQAAADLSGLQLLCSACTTFAKAGKRLVLTGDAPEHLTGLARRAGFTARPLADCDPARCLLAAK